LERALLYEYVKTSLSPYGIGVGHSPKITVFTLKKKRLKIVFLNIN